MEVIEISTDTLVWLIVVAIICALSFFSFICKYKDACEDLKKAKNDLHSKEQTLINVNRKSKEIEEYIQTLVSAKFNLEERAKSLTQENSFFNQRIQSLEKYIKTLDSAKDDLEKLKISTAKSYKKIEQDKQSALFIVSEEKQKAQTEIELLKQELFSNLSAIPWLARMMTEHEIKALSERCNEISHDILRFKSAQEKINAREILSELMDLTKEAKKTIYQSKFAEYQLKYLLAIYPEFEKVLKTEYKDLSLNGLLNYDMIKKAREKQLEDFFSSHKESMPWLAGMMADYLTYDIETLAQKLDWGENKERAKKVISIREIRAEAKRRIEEAKLATYQLDYLKTLYPMLEDILEVEYNELNYTGDIPEGDPVRNYLTKEEWAALSASEKNQLALDRYIESHKKSKWQIGRDYELSVAYEYINQGYIVDTHGSYMGLEDMGRDIIAKKDGITTIVQCKYWSKEKLIHENHIFQLFGSIVSYCTENNVDKNNIRGVLVTNIKASDTAIKVAQYLGIKISEEHAMTEFPRIKCNIGHSDSGDEHIYHLPMDEQYDSTKIDKPGEFYAFTVKEAEQAGFRRAYKHLHK